MSAPIPEQNNTWDDSQISQVRECLASFTESIGSPSHQHDATMDNSYTMGFRSPSMSALAGQTSPAQGRSLREYEEQMSALRKENFNLKLRIYFLEENAGLTTGASPTGADGTTTSGGTPESLIKQNIDLKVEVESLRKDLQEKQDLLLQAGKAMDLMEEGSRKAEEHNREIIDDLEHRLELLQHEIKQMEQAERQQQQQANMTRSRLNESGLMDFLEKMDHRELNVQDKVQALEMDSVVRQCHEQNEELCRKIGELHQQLEERELKIGALEAEVNDLRFECAELKDKLEENGKSTTDAERMTKMLQNSINTKEERIIHLNLENKVLKSLNDQLKERNIKLKEDSCTQLRIITDQSRLVQEMSDIIATKTVFQHGSSGQISKFKRERSKLLSEIEQLKLQAAAAKCRIRPRSMPAPPPPMALQFSRQRLCLEVLTQESSSCCSWAGSRRHSSSPLKSTKVGGSGQKKSGSETQIALIKQQETDQGGNGGDTKEWPLSGKASKSQYFDKIKIMRLKKDLFAAKSELADKLCQLDDTEVKLKEKTAEHIQAVKVVEKLCKTIPELEKEISRLKRNSHPEPNNLKEAVAKKIVSDPGSAAKNAAIIDENQQPVTQEEYEAVVQRLRAVQKKNESLIAKLTGGSTDRNENIIIKQLNEELIQAREETDKAQRWRKECMDLCAISTARLEELAGFLDSLLRNKEFSGSLPIDRRKAMRKAVDRSLDLSRSLNMSISVTGFSLPESSLAHLSCLSGYLDAGEESLLDANKENRHEESVGSVAKVIETLKAENRELRGQLAGHTKKDARRKLIPALAEPLSDSEAWSEPDRDVSQARIGLEERTSLPNSTGKVKSVTRSGVLQELSSTSENENVGYLKKHTAELKQLQETVGTLTGTLQEKDSKILDVQSRLVDLDNKLQEERMKASRMQSELENTRQVNQRLEKENGVQQDRTKKSEKRLEELTREIQQKDEVIEKLRKEREQAFVDLRVAVMKLDNLRTEHQEVQQKHKDQIETLLAQERQRLEDLRHDLTESFNSQLKAKQASFEASLSESYISKNIHQEKLKELQELMFRLDDTEMQLFGMSEDQARLKKQLQDAENAVQSMRKTLDETTSLASKAAIERSKALNEKRLLEDELKHCQDDLRAAKEEKNELNAKLQEIQGQLQLATQQRTPPKRLNSSSGAEGSTASGYTSEELLHVSGRAGQPNKPERPENSSPDLGIESDAGRLSHTENQASSTARPLLKTLELTRSMSNLLMEPKEEAIQELNSSATDAKPPHDCAKIEADHAELKRRYKQTRRHLELAYDSIKSANRRKERLEQDIKQQIQKTNVVLKTVRTNMTNELEKSPSSGEVRKSVPQA